MCVFLFLGGRGLYSSHRLCDKDCVVLQGADAGVMHAVGREEWALLGHLLAQFVGCHAHLLDAAGWASLRPRILALCARAAPESAGGEGGKGGAGATGEAQAAHGKAGQVEMQDVHAILSTCRERRERDALVSHIAPALRIFARTVQEHGGFGGQEKLVSDAGREHQHDEEDLLAKGQVWGLLGAARVMLILPVSPVDPASKFAVKLRAVERKLADLGCELLDCWWLL